MFGFFKDISKRTKVENELKFFFDNHTSINLHKISGWSLSKITDSYLNEIALYPNATDVEELMIYLMLLHDANAFDEFNNEMLLGVIIQIHKNDDDRITTEGKDSAFRKPLKEKITTWIHRKLIS